MLNLGKILLLSPWFYRLVRVCIGLVFVWAGAIKLIDLRAFARVIYEYGIVPDSLLVPVAVVLPAVEFLAGAGLVFDVKGSLNVILGLVMLFIAVLGYGIHSNMDIDCGCFTTEEIRARSSLQTAFYRDLILACAVLYLFAWRRTQQRVQRG